ncbi:MAG: ATPase, T2SS/T4P/T4SS family [Candidatus Micrarchaeia archaeon]
MLGWKILDGGEYEIGLRSLSEDEERLVLEVEERFKEKTRTKNISGEEDARDLVSRLVSDCSERAGFYTSDSQIEYLSESAYCHIYGFAFLSKLLEDDEIEEISIIGANKPAYIFLRNKGWKTVDAAFTTSDAIYESINKMAAKIGRRITLQNPRINAVLPDGSRLHASLPPLSAGEITIRKFRDSPFSPSELCTNDTLSANAMAFLSLAMQGDFSIILAGNTASGKTTTMNSLFSFVPFDERIILVEETPEINIFHPHQLRLVSNPEMNISLKDLVRDSLRMRPDRLVVGEVRSKEEVEALFDVLLGGQARGSYATFHAKSGKEALQRFRSFGINDADAGSIDLIVVQRRMLCYDRKKRKNYEVRRVVEISEVAGSGTGIPIVVPVFSSNHGSLSGSLSFNKKSNFVSRLAGELGLSEKEFSSELKEREKLISSMKQKDFSQSFSKIQKAFYGIDCRDDMGDEHDGE